MIVKHLGPEIDIHCGGIDNLYRHHDYTIAIVESYSGAQLAPYWLHGEHLLVDGRKMSKRKANVLYPETIWEKGYEGADVRFFFALHHYRRPLNFTWHAFDMAQRRRNHLVRLSRVFTGAQSPEYDVANYGAHAHAMLGGFEKALGDDLSTAQAIRSLEHFLPPLAEARKEGKIGENETHEIGAALRRIDTVLAIGL
jgi:cysteinyl-tRNA synthetase